MTKKKPTPPEPEGMNLADFGKRLVILGEAFQNPKTKLDDIAALALQCGLVLHLGLGPKRRQRKALDFSEPGT